MHGPDIAPDVTNPLNGPITRQVILRDHAGGPGAYQSAFQLPLLEQVYIVHTISELLAGAQPQFSPAAAFGCGRGVLGGDDKKTDLGTRIDFANPQHNEFLVINQFWSQAPSSHGDLISWSSSTACASR